MHAVLSLVRRSPEKISRDQHFSTVVSPLPARCEVGLALLRLVLRGRPGNFEYARVPGSTVLRALQECPLSTPATDALHEILPLVPRSGPAGMANSWQFPKMHSLQLGGPGRVLVLLPLVH